MDINALLRAEADKLKEDLRKWEGKIGDKDITLFSTPISPYDTSVVSAKFPKFETAPSASAMVYLICHKATDKDGNKVFSVGRDFKVMERLPVEFTAGIAQKLFADDFDEDDLSLENLEKN